MYTTNTTCATQAATTNLLTSQFERHLFERCCTIEHTTKAKTKTKAKRKTKTKTKSRSRSKSEPNKKTNVSNKKTNVYNKHNMCNPSSGHNLKALAV